MSELVLEARRTAVVVIDLQKGIVGSRAILIRRRR